MGNAIGEKETINEATEKVSRFDIGFFFFEILFLFLLVSLSGYLSFYSFQCGVFWLAIVLAIICLICIASVVRTLKHKSLAGDIHYSSFL